MALIGLRDSSPAGIILSHIQRHGQTTVKELEHVLGVSTTAVREHLAHLQASGLVVTGTLRNGPGRPRLVYYLTDKAHTLFPKHYDILIHLLLRELIARDGRERVNELLEHVGKRMASEYAAQVSAEDVQLRLSELHQMLEARGIAADVEPEGDGLNIHSCPFYEVAQKHGEVCTMERQMFEQVLGAELIQEHSIRDGHHCCRFALNDRPAK